MGRLHRWPALRCLLHMWNMSLLLRAYLAKLKKSMLFRPNLEEWANKLSWHSWHSWHTLSLILSNVEGANLVWPFIMTIHVYSCDMAFFLYKQREWNSQLAPASWEHLDLLIWPKLCEESLKETVLPLLSPSCNCLKPLKHSVCLISLVNCLQTAR